MKHLKHKPGVTTECRSQAGNFTATDKVNIGLCFPEFISKKIMIWKCHMDALT